MANLKPIFIVFISFQSFIDKRRMDRQ